jgi:hypothetical protein
MPDTDGRADVPRPKLILASTLRTSDGQVADLSSGPIGQVTTVVANVASESKELSGAVREIAEAFGKGLAAAAESLRPDKVTIELSFEIETALNAVFIKGKGAGSIGLTLEWQRDRKGS